MSGIPRHLLDIYVYVVVLLLNCVLLFAAPWIVARHAPRPSLSPRVCSNSCPLSWWCCLTILSSVAPFSFCLQSFPVSGSLPTSQLFTSHGQSIGASTSASVLPMNIQEWFPLELTGLIFAVQGILKSLLQHYNSKAPIFDTQPSLWSNCHIHTWLLEKP